MNLAAQIAEQALDRGVDVLVGIGHAALAGDPVERLGNLHQFLGADESSSAQALGVLLGGRAVVGKKLAVGCAQKFRHFRRKLLLDSVRPKWHYELSSG